MANWHVREFGKMTKVSVRTLHHYDKIDLLKPSIRKSNGYRLYSEGDLLKLQRILALKFFGLSLDKIKILMEKNDDALDHLRAQKRFLQDKVVHLQIANQLLESLINKLEKGAIDLDDVVKLIKEYQMRDEHFYDVDSKKQKEYEDYLLDSGKVTKEQIAATRKKAKSLKKEDIDTIKAGWNDLLEKFADAMQRKLKPSDPEVQALIHKLYQNVSFFGTPNKENFAGIGQLYCEHPDFRKMYEAYHIGMPEYLAEGMKIYSEVVLS